MPAYSALFIILVAHLNDKLISPQPSPLPRLHLSTTQPMMMMIIIIILKASTAGTMAAFPGLLAVTQDAVAALQTFLLLAGIEI